MHFDIIPPNRAIATDLREKINGKTKPLGALGRLEALALQIGLVQQTLNPQLRQPQIVVFAGDHGAAHAGVSAYPQEVTWQMVDNFLAGGAAINVFSRQLELGLSVVDAGVNHDFAPRSGLINAKIAPGTANYLEQPAMSTAQRDAALQRGRELAHALADNGCNCVGFGEMGIGNTASASLLTVCLVGAAHGADLYTVTGRGTGLDDAGLARKRKLLKTALRRGGYTTDPLQALSEYGGFEIAMMTGAMLGAAERKILIVVDGFIVTAALLVAAAINHNLMSYCIFAHRSLEPGHRIQLDFLRAEPLMELDLRLGEGTGAALAFPLIHAAINFLNEMASFSSAGVSEKEARR